MMPLEWYIAFVCPTEDKPRRWWHAWMKGPYDHCFAFGYVPHKAWVLVDWSSQGLMVRLLEPKEIGALVVEIYRANGLILGHAAVVDNIVMPRLPIYCVSMVKQLLGLRSFAVTPTQLAGELQAMGCRRMFGATEAILRGGHEQPLQTQEVQA